MAKPAPSWSLLAGSRHTSVQLNGTGRPILVHRISVRDEEVVGSNPATPTCKGAVQSLDRRFDRGSFCIAVRSASAAGFSALFRASSRVTANC
jgi:hypothetical protein